MVNVGKYTIHGSYGYYNVVVSKNFDHFSFIMIFQKRVAKNHPIVYIVCEWPRHSNSHHQDYEPFLVGDSYLPLLLGGGHTQYIVTYISKRFTTRIKENSWVPMGEYPRYIPTYTTYIRLYNGFMGQYGVSCFGNNCDRVPSQGYPKFPFNLDSCHLCEKSLAGKKKTRRTGEVFVAQQKTCELKSWKPVVFAVPPPQETSKKLP